MVWWAVALFPRAGPGRVKDRSLPARVVGTHSLFLSANTQKDAASGGYLADAARERVLRFRSRGASGGCRADASADRMLSLLREE
jgi:hypothetical protein